MAHKQLVEICNWEGMPVEIDLTKVNWLPVCIAGIQWYVNEYSTFNNNTGVESTPIKIYKQGAEGVITTTVPPGARQQGYCTVTPTTTNVNVPQCNGTTSVQAVNSQVAAYIMNTHHYTTETVYDTVNVSIGGTITPTITAPSTLNIPTVSVTNANDTLLGYLVDYGNGFTDIIFAGATSTYDFVNQPISKYEVKIFGIYQSGNIILLSGIEYNFNGTTLTQLTASPVSINRSFPRLVGTAKQRFCDNTPVGSAFTPSGVYSIIGTLGFTQPIIRDEKFEGADSTLSNLLTNPIAAENASTDRITAAQALNTTTVTNPTFVGARDVTVYNSKNVTVAFEYTTSINGTFHRVNIPANGTWSNTLKRDDYTNEGVYTGGRIITAYTATTAPGEININWTT